MRKSESQPAIDGWFGVKNSRLKCAEDFVIIGREAWQICFPYESFVRGNVSRRFERLGKRSELHRISQMTATADTSNRVGATEVQQQTNEGVAETKTTFEIELSQYVALLQATTCLNDAGTAHLRLAGTAFEHFWVSFRLQISAGPRADDATLRVRDDACDMA